jgi:hypothetical protein
MQLGGVGRRLCVSAGTREERAMTQVARRQSSESMARLHDGVLAVRIAKRAADKRQIEIQ